jgi:hypothetical protein
MLLACVGLAWSQTSSTPRPESASERILTLNENGKSLRCRVVQSWRTAAGTQAHQLQNINTGEMITIVEDGQPTSVANGSGSQSRALPMRIFHWGFNSKTPPAGAPMPPPAIDSSRSSAAAKTPTSVMVLPAIDSAKPAPVVIKPAATQTVTAVPAGAAPQLSAGACSPQCDPCAVGGSPRILTGAAGRNESGERLIVWEEGTNRQIVQNGSTSGPVIVNGGQNCCDTAIDNSKPTIRERMTNFIHKPAAVKPADTIIVKPADPMPIKPIDPVATKPAEPKPLAVNSKPADPVPVPAIKKDDKKPSPLIVNGKPADSVPAPAIKKDDRKPFSTATAQSQPTPITGPTIMNGADTVKKDAVKKDAADFNKMWGTQPSTKIQPPPSLPAQPTQTAVEREKVRKDILMAPERFNPPSEKANPKAEMASIPMTGTAMRQPTGSMPMPLGAASVLAAGNGIPGAVQYIPVPVATVPEPIRPPSPPPGPPQPVMPPQFVNAFSSPLPPGMTPAMLAREQGMQQQAMLQQSLMRQHMLQQMAQAGYGMEQQMAYAGPLPPNPFQTVGYNMMPNGMMFNPAMDRRVQTVAAQMPAPETTDLGKLISMLQESPYPAQREWAATNLAAFDARVHPHLPAVLMQAAKQDAAATVRAAAVYSLSRLNMPSDAVMNTLQSLRSDADPRVRQEAEDAFVRMGATRQ